MMNKIKCFFGFHDWDTNNVKTADCVLWRFCRHCNLRQIGQYDMMYGCTYWENR